MTDSVENGTNPVAIEKPAEVAETSEDFERNSATSQSSTIVNETISDDIVIGQSIFRTNSPQPQNSSLSNLSMISSQTSATSNDSESIYSVPDPVFRNFVQNADILKSLSSLSQLKNEDENVFDENVDDGNVDDENVVDENIDDQNIVCGSNVDGNVADEKNIAENIVDKNIVGGKIVQRDIVNKDIANENIVDKIKMEEKTTNQNNVDANDVDENINDKNIADQNAVEKIFVNKDVVDREIVDREIVTNDFIAKDQTVKDSVDANIADNVNDHCIEDIIAQTDEKFSTSETSAENFVQKASEKFSKNVENRENDPNPKNDPGSDHFVDKITDRKISYDKNSENESITCTADNQTEISCNGRTTESITDSSMTNIESNDQGSTDQNLSPRQSVKDQLDMNHIKMNDPGPTRTRSKCFSKDSDQTPANDSNNETIRDLNNNENNERAGEVVQANSASDFLSEKLSSKKLSEWKQSTDHFSSETLSPKITKSSSNELSSNVLSTKQLSLSKSSSAASQSLQARNLSIEPMSTQSSTTRVLLEEILSTKSMSATKISTRKLSADATDMNDETELSRKTLLEENKNTDLVQTKDSSNDSLPAENSLPTTIPPLDLSCLSYQDSMSDSESSVALSDVVEEMVQDLSNGSENRPKSRKEIRTHLQEELKDRVLCLSRVFHLRNRPRKN